MFTFRAATGAANAFLVIQHLDNECKSVGVSYDFNTSFQLHGRFKFIHAAAAKAVETHALAAACYTYAVTRTSAVKVMNLYEFVVATSHECAAFFDNLRILLASGILANKI